jgi:hypothetical protein
LKAARSRVLVHPAKPKVTVCPWCGKHHDLASAAAEDGDKGVRMKPVDGDVTLCIGCGNWSIFERKAAGGLRKPNYEERQHMRMDRLMRRVQRAWRRTVKPESRRAAEPPP